MLGGATSGIAVLFQRQFALGVLLGVALSLLVYLIHVTSHSLGGTVLSEAGSMSASPSFLTTAPEMTRVLLNNRIGSWSHGWEFSVDERRRLP
jgi:hypothetical protein